MCYEWQSRPVDCEVLRRQERRRRDGRRGREHIYFVTQFTREGREEWVAGRMPQRLSSRLGRGLPTWLSRWLSRWLSTQVSGYLAVVVKARRVDGEGGPGHEAGNPAGSAVWTDVVKLAEREPLPDRTGGDLSGVGEGRSIDPCRPWIRLFRARGPGLRCLEHR